MMKVLTDFHHAGLLNSLIMLFEGRLGGEVYRPIGMEWAERGFWKVYDHPATQEQYLTLSQGYSPEDGTDPLNIVEGMPEPGVYYCRDIDSEFYNKAITFDAFANTTFDIIIASLPQHIEPFKKLIELYQPQAKLIFQVGNQWDGIDAPNIMASAKLSGVPDHIPYVEYHQEFDLNIFKPQQHYQINTIVSMMNVPDQFPDYPLLLEIERMLPQHYVSIYGGQGRDGAMHGSVEVASALRNSQWLWHVKYGGDGYGHILFNAAACGVPMIVKRSYYQGKLGEKLLIPDVTCIDIDGLSLSAIVSKIQLFSQPQIHETMRKAVYDNFLQVVNFDQDELNIREFLARLK